jgi:hypothetical protein
MKKLTAFCAAFGLLLLTACQPIMPMTVVPENDLNQSASAAPTTDTEATVGTGSPGPIHCLVDFEAAVRQGPSTGITLQGVLDFKVNELGTLHGMLLQADQSQILVAGQVEGRAIHLVFVVGEQKFVFGVGTTLNQIKNDECGVALGGPFVGPEPGDSGDWLGFGRGAEPGSTPSMCDDAGCAP